MYRRQLDANLIETYFSAPAADGQFAPAKKQLLKRLLAEAGKLGLSVYGFAYTNGIRLDISIGDSMAENAPGELSLTVMDDCVKFENLTINKFYVDRGRICDKPKSCSQACMEKFGWYNYSGHNYCSLAGHFDFALSMLPNWLKKLNAMADAIVLAKAQITKSNKIAEIKADHMRGILESVAASIEEKLPELKCKLKHFLEQKSFGLWLYNVEIDRTMHGVSVPLGLVFKPAEEYTRFSPSDIVFLGMTRRQLEEQNLKPVRMFTIEKCVKPSVVGQHKLEYVVWFVYDESGDWRCKSPTALPGFENSVILPTEQIKAWVSAMIDAEIGGYSVFKDYEDRMKLLAGEKYGRWTARCD